VTLIASLQNIGLLLAVMAGLAFVEALIPLRALGPPGRKHILPNLALTLITVASNLILNIPILIGLAWLQAHHLGLFNTWVLPPAATIFGAVVVLDFAWYVTHVTMHKVPALWRFHAVHHSDAAIDVTTTIRQHPGESLIRYAFLAAFAFAIGAPPAGFALYRVWSALHGLTEHANVRLPQWLDTAITWVFSSPNMHKVHHAREAALTDRNYTNIFSLWDRLFGTFMPSVHGRDIAYGLDGFDAPERQTICGLLALPFRMPRREIPSAVALRGAAE
jgi:sterol desaturase/sphingolipid hydroxylase (fatty acid hydroxylase superfamily)